MSPQEHASRLQRTGSLGWGWGLRWGAYCWVCLSHKWAEGACRQISSPEDALCTASTHLIRWNSWECSLSCRVLSAVGRRGHFAVCPRDAGGTVPTRCSCAPRPMFPVPRGQPNAAGFGWVSSIWVENSVKSYANKFELSRIAVREKPVAYEYAGREHATFKVNSARSHGNSGAGECGGAPESSPPDQKAPTSWFLLTNPFFSEVCVVFCSLQPPLPYGAAHKVVAREPASCSALLAAKGTDVFHCQRLISHNPIKRCFDVLGGKHHFWAVRNLFFRLVCALGRSKSDDRF